MAGDFDQFLRQSIIIAEPNKRDVQAFCRKRLPSQSRFSPPDGCPACKRHGDRAFKKNGEEQSVVPAPIQFLPVENGLAVFGDPECGQLIHVIAPLKSHSRPAKQNRTKREQINGNDTSAGAGSINARNHISVGRMLMAQAP
ncbi:hypothetical protein NKJ87_22575 [Mesorhizobium sp. M0027]|uniref:hypothetical protein n=1 Tax=unclassified Mesorhizobium TaxID=325217 RepID=UPI00333D5058